MTGLTEGAGIYFSVNSQVYIGQDVGYNDYAGTFTASQAPEITQAPEMDPNVAASGAALLVGGLLVLRGRKQRAVAA